MNMTVRVDNQLSVIDAHRNLAQAEHAARQAQEDLKAAQDMRSEAAWQLTRAMERESAQELFGDLAGSTVVAVFADALTVRGQDGELRFIVPRSKSGKRGALFTYFSRPDTDFRVEGELVGMTLTEGACTFEDGQMRPRLYFKRGELSCAIYPPGDYEGWGGLPGSFEIRRLGQIPTAACRT
jgi:hypothetical protein